MTTELTFKDIGDKEIVDGDTVKDTSIKTNATPATFVFVLVIMSREDPCFQRTFSSWFCQVAAIEQVPTK